jgi:glycosyltransferase involved in cell wall biosynthesis
VDGGCAASRGAVRHARSRLRAALHALAFAVTAALFVVVAPVARLRRRRRPRIMWGTTPIANLRNSVAADRLSGYSSESVVYYPYRAQDVAVFDHVLQMRLPVLRQVLPYGALIWAALRYDIFCLYFDGGLLGPTPYARFELPLLKLAGKKILVWPYGGDARLPSLTRARGGWHAYSDVEPGAEDRNETETRRRLEAFGRWADVICGCADVLEELPRVDDVLPYPFDDATWSPVAESEDGVVRVVHAPNHRHYKGTQYLIDAVEQLRAEGLPIELVLVEGKGPDEARRVYEQADIVVDQLLIGAYALLAIEAMALGKPVVCYLNDRFRAHHPEWEQCPIVSATPETVTEVLRGLVTDPERLRELGRRGPSYVHDVHSLRAFAAKTAPKFIRLWTPAQKDRDVAGEARGSV